MTCYVDDLIDYGRRTKQRGLNYAVWCHLAADSIEELHAMADTLRLKRTWFQPGPGGRFPHYDLVPSKRALALNKGAIGVTSRQMAEILMRNRARGTVRHKRQTDGERARRPERPRTSLLDLRARAGDE